MKLYEAILYWKLPLCERIYDSSFFIFNCISYIFLAQSQ